MVSLPLSAFCAEQAKAFVPHCFRPCPTGIPASYSGVVCRLGSWLGYLGTAMTRDDAEQQRHCFWPQPGEMPTLCPTEGGVELGSVLGDKSPSPGCSAVGCEWVGKALSVVTAQR